ncbi:MAG: ABC transporter permease [Gaiellales bacterium]
MSTFRVVVHGGITSYRALFNWISPWVFIPHTLGYPIFEILFFAYLGRFADVESDEFFLVGNAFLAIAVTGLFGMGHAVAGERKSQTLMALLASPANRFAVFLGRALPSIFTGFVVAATAFTVCALILGVHIDADAIPRLCVAVVATSFGCTAMGLCLGALGLRGRNVSLFADLICAGMLVVSGANIPLDRLPGWVQAISMCIPLTRGIEAARELAAGATLGDVSGLLTGEVAVGIAYLLVGLAMLHLFEYEGRRSATLEAF